MVIVKYEVIICLETSIGANLGGCGFSNKFLATKGITKNSIKIGLQKHLICKKKNKKNKYH